MIRLGWSWFLVPGHLPSHVPSLRHIDQESDLRYFTSLHDRRLPSHGGIGTTANHDGCFTRACSTDYASSRFFVALEIMQVRWSTGGLWFASWIDRQIDGQRQGQGQGQRQTESERVRPWDRRTKMEAIRSAAYLFWFYPNLTPSSLYNLYTLLVSHLGWTDKAKAGAPSRPWYSILPWAAG